MKPADNTPPLTRSSAILTASPRAEHGSRVLRLVAGTRGEERASHGAALEVVERGAERRRGWQWVPFCVCHGAGEAKLPRIGQLRTGSDIYARALVQLMKRENLSGERQPHQHHREGEEGTQQHEEHDQTAA